MSSYQRSVSGYSARGRHASDSPFDAWSNAGGDSFGVRPEDVYTTDIHMEITGKISDKTLLADVTPSAEDFARDFFGPEIAAIERNKDLKSKDKKEQIAAFLGRKVRLHALFLDRTDNDCAIPLSITMANGTSDNFDGKHRPVGAVIPVGLNNKYDDLSVMLFDSKDVMDGRVNTVLGKFPNFTADNLDKRSVMEKPRDLVVRDGDHPSVANKTRLVAMDHPALHVMVNKPEEFDDIEDIAADIVMSTYPKSGEQLDWVQVPREYLDRANASLRDSVFSKVTDKNHSQMVLKIRRGDGRKHTDTKGVSAPVSHGDWSASKLLDKECTVRVHLKAMYEMLPPE